MRTNGVGDLPSPPAVLAGHPACPVRPPAPEGTGLRTLETGRPSGNAADEPHPDAPRPRESRAGGTQRGRRHDQRYGRGAAGSERGAVKYVTAPNHPVPPFVVSAFTRAAARESWAGEAARRAGRSPRIAPATGGSNCCNASTVGSVPEVDAPRSREPGWGPCWRGLLAKGELLSIRIQHVHLHLLSTHLSGVVPDGRPCVRIPADAEEDLPGSSDSYVRNVEGARVQVPSPPSRLARALGTP